MLFSLRGKSACVGSVLLLQAAATLPAYAVEPAEPAASAELIDHAAPLDGTVLSQVTAMGIGDSARVAGTPMRAFHEGFAFFEETSGSAASLVQAASLQLPRAPADAWAGLSGLRQPMPLDFHGISQDATNLALTVTLNGTNFVYVRP